MLLDADCVVSVVRVAEISRTIKGARFIQRGVILFAYCCTSSVFFLCFSCFCSGWCSVDNEIEAEMNEIDLFLSVSYGHAAPSQTINVWMENRNTHLPAAIKERTQVWLRGPP